MYIFFVKVGECLEFSKGQSLVELQGVNQCDVHHYGLRLLSFLIRVSENCQATGKDAPKFTVPGIPRDELSYIEARI